MDIDSEPTRQGICPLLLQASSFISYCIWFALYYLSVALETVYAKASVVW